MADEEKRARYVRYQFGSMFGIYDRRTNELVASGPTVVNERAKLLELLGVEEAGNGNSLDWLAGTDELENIIEDLDEIQLIEKARERAAATRRRIEEKYAEAKAELEQLQSSDPLAEERAAILERREQRRLEKAEAEAAARKAEREERRAAEAAEAEADTPPE